MKKKSLVCLAFLCFLMSLMGVGCSATRESTDSSVSKAHEDTQITEHTGHGSESSTKAETEEPILQTVIIQQVRDNSITVEHIVLLNSYLEEDLQTLKDLNIPPEEYQYGYYRKDSGEIYTYDVGPGTPVTIYDISQEYGAGEDRLYTFETWQKFVSAVQANERLLIQPYTLTIQDGVVTKIAEKFYN